MQPPDFKRIYTERDFETLGFHDCYLRSIRWDRDCLWELEFSQPAGSSNELWASGFQLTIQAAPVLSKLQKLR